MKNVWKKGLALMLAVTTCFSAVSVPVHAQGESVSAGAAMETEVTGETATEEMPMGEEIPMGETASGDGAGATTEDVTETEETVNTEEAASTKETANTEEAGNAEEGSTDSTDDGAEEGAGEQVPTESVFEGGNFRVTFTLTSYWEEGYNANIRLENTGDSSLQNWYLGFHHGNPITGIWNAEIHATEGDAYVIKNAGWNRDIAVGNSIEFGISCDHAFRGFPEGYELLGASAEVTEGDYVMQYHVDGDWGTGFYGSVSVTNHSGTAIEDWVLEFDFDREVTNIWNGVIEERQGNHYVIRNAGYNGNIAPGESVSIGMQGVGGEPGDEPRGYVLRSSGMFRLVHVMFDVCADEVSNVPREQTVSPGERVNVPTSPTRDGYVFVGWYLSASYEEEFDFETRVEEDITLCARWFNCMNHTDTDGDGVIDELEALLGTDPNLTDTDGDGLSDHDEIWVLFTDPLKADTDGNGIEDGDEDHDGDGLANKFELDCGSDPTMVDTDGDKLSDHDEVYLHKTNVNLKDTDADGVSDGKEVELGTDPLAYQSTFHVNVTAGNCDGVIPSVEIELTGKQVETLSIDVVEDDLLFPKTIPGYVGAACDFRVAGTFDEAVLRFQFEESLLESEGFDPVIYYFNEAEQQLEPLETRIDGNVASARTTHFSKYILINRKVFEESKTWIDVWSAKGFSGVEVVLLIDDSSNMMLNDTKYKRLALTRDFVDNLPPNSKIGVIKCDASSTVLTSSMTQDKEEVKKYLTTQYFDASGNTYVYRAMNKAFDLFSGTDDDVLKIMVVLTDNNTIDVSLYEPMATNANERNIKLYNIILGDGKLIFKNTSDSMVNMPKQVLTLASTASQLEDVFMSINFHLHAREDIEKDSDQDGIPDYYEDNLVLFNNTKIKLDKHNPDTDGDGLTDGQEVVELRYEYNEDRSKVRVTGKLLSSPINADTDGDLDVDSIDPEPFDHQLNNLLCYNLCKLNDLAIKYKNGNHYDPNEFDAAVEAWLTFMFIRQFSSSYVGGNWDGTGKSIETGFVEYVRNENPELYTYFETKRDFYANARGETGDLRHLAATATGYIYHSGFGDGLKFGVMPEHHLNNLSGWAGDLQTAMNDAMKIVKNPEDYDEFKTIMKNLIGYDASVSDVYAGKNHSFDICDVYADTDAYNIYKLLKAGMTMEEALDEYFKTGYLKRYGRFTNDWSEAKIKEITYIYTKHKYLLFISWPLFNYPFKTTQSKAARDAFAEFLLIRRKYE